MGDSDAWARLQQGAALPGERTRKPVRRRALTAVLMLVVAVLVVVGGAYLAEDLTRGVAEDAVAAAVESNLPANVDGTVAVDIAGDWVLLQLVTGRIDNVTLTSDDLTVDDIPIENLTITASGVPLDIKAAVGNIAATASFDAATLNQLLTLPGNDPEVTLGDGTVGYEDTTEVFGVPVGYVVTASLAPDGTDVLLTPQSTELTTGMGNIDVSGLVDRILGAGPVRVCLADKIPLGATISAIEVRDGIADLSMAASDFILSDPSSRATGECPA